MPHDPPAQDRAESPTQAPTADPDASRRALLERLAKVGYVAPAMLALLATRPADADIITCPPEGCE
jgi:hypothetical protein